MTYLIPAGDYVAKCTITFDDISGVYEFDTDCRPEDKETVEDTAWEMFRKEREEQRELAQENYSNRHAS
jgi:hypothetical protein